MQPPCLLGLRVFPYPIKNPSIKPLISSFCNPILSNPQILHKPSIVFNLYLLPFQFLIIIFSSRNIHKTRICWSYVFCGFVSIATFKVRYFSVIVSESQFVGLCVCIFVCLPFSRSCSDYFPWDWFRENMACCLCFGPGRKMNLKDNSDKKSKRDKSSSSSSSGSSHYL